MDGIQEAILAKLPLAEGVWWLYRHAFDDDILEQIWESGRGRCYTRQIEFPDLVRIMHDALVPLDSGRESIEKQREDGLLQASATAVFGKLTVALSPSPVFLSDTLPVMVDFIVSGARLNAGAATLSSSTLTVRDAGK